MDFKYIFLKILYNARFGGKLYLNDKTPAAWFYKSSL